MEPRESKLNPGRQFFKKIQISVWCCELHSHPERKRRRGNHRIFLGSAIHRVIERPGLNDLQ